jgi:hypothetical protein
LKRPRIVLSDGRVVKRLMPITLFRPLDVKIEAGFRLSGPSSVHHDRPQTGP